MGRRGLRGPAVGGRPAGPRGPGARRGPARRASGSRFRLRQAAALPARRTTAGGPYPEHRVGRLPRTVVARPAVPGGHRVHHLTRGGGPHQPPAQGRGLRSAAAARRRHRDVDAARGARRRGLHPRGRPGLLPGPRRQHVHHGLRRAARRPAPAPRRLRLGARQVRWAAAGVRPAGAVGAYPTRPVRAAARLPGVRPGSHGGGTGRRARGVRRRVPARGLHEAGRVPGAAQASAHRGAHHAVPPAARALGRGRPGREWLWWRSWKRRGI